MEMMVTNLKDVPHETKPGREIETNAFYTSNPRISNMLDVMAREMISMIESESNNMTGELVPRNVASIQLGYSTLIEMWNDAKNMNDPVTPIYEFSQKTSLPTPQVVAAMPNLKLRLICKEYRNAAEIIISVDSARSKGNVSAGSESKIEAALTMLKTMIDKYLGTGRDNSDVGLNVPVYGHVGRLIPDVHDHAFIAEASSDQPFNGRPDAADLPASGD